YHADSRSTRLVDSTLEDATGFAAADGTPGSAAISQATHRPTARNARTPTPIEDCATSRESRPPPTRKRHRGVPLRPPRHEAIMQKKNRQAGSTGLGLIAIIAAMAAADADRAGASEPVPGVPWPATDALGRSLPVAGDRGIPGPRPGHHVGMFYFLWHNDSRGKPPAGSGPYDVSRILARQPDARRRPESTLWGPVGMYHYWAEPLYGYYFSADPWVLGRHAELLAAAGIDVLIFDTTNAVTY